MTSHIRQARDKNNTLVAQQLREKPASVRGMPDSLTIETGAVCSLKCVFCPQSDPDFDLSRDFLSVEEFKRTVDSFEGCLELINLFNWGEPLLNPSLPKMVQYATEKEIYSVVHSNLNFVTPALAEALVSSGLSKLVASIDGASEETYSKYRTHGSFSTALSNLKLFINTKKKLGLTNPKIFWKFLVFRHNEHELAKAKEMAADMGVEIKFQFAAVARKEFESTLEDYNGNDFLKKFAHDYGSPCDALWKNPVVHPGGIVFPCCMIVEKKYAVGNLLENDFRSIWNNEKYQELRNIVSGRVRSSESSFCGDCIYRPITGDQKQQKS